MNSSGSSRYRSKQAGSVAARSGGSRFHRRPSSARSASVTTYSTPYLRSQRERNASITSSRGLGGRAARVCSPDPGGGDDGGDGDGEGGGFVFASVLLRCSAPPCG